MAHEALATVRRRRVGESKLVKSGLPALLADLLEAKHLIAGYFALFHLTNGSGSIGNLSITNEMSALPLT